MTFKGIYKPCCHSVLQVVNDFFVFYVYRPLTSKNAKGINGGFAYFRERTCSRKEIRQYTGKPEERGLYLSEGVLLVFV